MVDIVLPGRLFSDWSMALVDLSDPARAKPGFAGFPSYLGLNPIDDGLELLNFFSEQRAALDHSETGRSFATMLEPATRPRNFARRRRAVAVCTLADSSDALASDT